MKILFFGGRLTATPILSRTYSGLCLEKARERGLLAKAQKVADLLNGVILTCIEQHFGAGGEKVCNPFFRTDAGVFLDRLGEVLRGKTADAGIESHFVRLPMVLDDGLVEAVEQLLVGRKAV